MAFVNFYLDSIKKALTVAFRDRFDDDDTFDVEILPDMSIIVDGTPTVVDRVKDERQDAIDSLEQGDCQVNYDIDLDHCDDLFQDVTAFCEIKNGQLSVHAAIRTSVDELTEHLVSIGMPAPTKRKRPDESDDESDDELPPMSRASFAKRLRTVVVQSDDEE